MPAFAIAARSRASRASSVATGSSSAFHPINPRRMIAFPYAATLNSSRAVPVSTSQPSLVTATPSPSTM